MLSLCSPAIVLALLVAHIRAQTMSSIVMDLTATYPTTSIYTQSPVTTPYTTPTPTDFIVSSSDSSDAIWCGCPGAPHSCRDDAGDGIADSCWGPNQDDCTNVGQFCGPATEKRIGPRPRLTPEPLVVPNIVLSDEQLEQYKALEIDFLTSALQNPTQGQEPLELPYCGFTPEPPSSSSTKSLKRRGISWKKVVKGAKKILTPPKRPTPPVICPRSPPRLDLEIQFNVISTNLSNNDLVTEALLDVAVAELSAAWNIPMGVTFTRWPGGAYRKWKTASLEFAPSLADQFTFAQLPRYDYELQKRVMMSSAYRRGISLEVVNIFVVEQITDTNSPAFCWLPGWPVELDGCVIALDEFTGVSFLYPDTSGRNTLSHEVGHWFGLLHTFDTDDEEKAGGTCSGNNRITSIPQYSKGDATELDQYPCPDPSKPPSFSLTSYPVRQVNWMSYSPAAGTTCVPGKDPWCVEKWSTPWLPEQQASAFAAFYIFRRGYDAKYNECFGPHERVSRQKRGAPHPDTPSTYRRLLQHSNRLVKRVDTAYDQFEQRPNLVDELQAVCATPWTPDEDPIIVAAIPDRENDICDAPLRQPFSIEGSPVTLSDGRIGVGIPVGITVTLPNGVAELQTVTVSVPTAVEVDTAFVIPTSGVTRMPPWASTKDATTSAVGWAKAHAGLLGGVVAAAVVVLAATGLICCVCARKRRVGGRVAYQGVPVYSRSSAGEEGVPLRMVVTEQRYYDQQ